MHPDRGGKIAPDRLANQRQIAVAGDVGTGLFDDERFITSPAR